MNKRDFARQLRHRSTDAERLLWHHLRNRRFAGFKFRRQEPVGAYIPDFVCPRGCLIVELDGGQHTEQHAYDERRDAWLARQGFRILRFPDNYVLANLEGTLETIWRALGRDPDSRKE
jgi:very-short-patch-repair endonuclease